MKCTKVQKNVFLHNKANKRIESHLQECEECRAIALALERFVSAKPSVDKYKIPKAIDASITTEAQAFVEERSMNSEPAAKDMLRPFHRWGIVIAYAACFMLVVWMIVSAFSSGNKIQHIDTENTVSPVLLNQKLYGWNNLDMDEDIFILNTQIEIDFASLAADK